MEGERDGGVVAWFRVTKTKRKCETDLDNSILISFQMFVRKIKLVYISICFPAEAKQSQAGAKTEIRLLMEKGRVDEGEVDVVEV